MPIRPPPRRPVILALRLGDRLVVDAGVAVDHQAVVVEFPVFVAVAAVPLAGVVVPFVGEADGDAMAAEGPS